MIELKAGVIVTPHDEGMCFNRGSDVIAVTERETEFYLKSEADKVIAEKDTEIAELLAEVEDVINTYKASVESKVKIWERCKKAEADTAEKDKEISHQKYKRCLTMAMLCSSYKFAWSFIPEDDEVHKIDFYKKWKKRWLELAEQFKEA